MTTLSSVFSPDLTLLDSICIGSGRFLRAVLVPALVSADYHPCIIQTRGKSFLEFSCETNKFSYEVDTVHYDGKVETTAIPYWGAGTLGTPEGKKDVLDLLASKKLGTSASKPFLLGIGVTEAGLSSASTKAMKDLYDILKCLSKRNEFQKTKICVINTDNVSQNGTLMQEFMNELASGDEVMETFCSHFVVFHNTMVDRITSHRPESEMIPRAEPTPSKALVIEDLESILQPIFGSLRKSHGVVIRSSKGQLDADIALKLRVANGTHTAAAHTMALTGLVMTDVLSSDSEQSKLLLNYLDSLVANQIVPGVEATADFSATKAETQAVYDDWRRRLIHAHFGLSTFFITQNGAAKGGIRIGPTIRDLIQSSSDIQCSTVFSLSALLRFLTHTGTKAKEANLYVGWFDPEKHEESKTIPYADGLEYNISEGWYYFRCGCTVRINGEETPLPMALHNIGLKQQPIAYESVIESYLCQSDGGNLGKVSDTSAFTILVRAVATLYARMMAGDALMDILGSLDMEASCESLVDVPYNCTIEAFDASRPLHYQKASIPDDSLLLEAPLVKDTIESVVVSEVASAMAVDLHTHLLPPTHGALCLWGIDELLTYHYLVAEYFVTAPPSVTPESFFALSKQNQADLVWKALFLERSPISEACRGVITTCVALGLSKEIQNRDLDAIRDFYRQFRNRGQEGAEAFSERVFAQAGIDYAVMTNIPFEPTETQHWRPKKEYSKSFRSACRVDPLLAGNKEAVETALRASGYETTLQGARQFLHDWCDTMKPEYLMASTPHDFVLPEDRGTIENVEKTGVNEEAMKEPFAFANLVKRPQNDNNSNPDSCGTDCGTELPSVIDETSDFLSEVLMRVAEERDLPLALKIGAHRGVNPKLLSAGDGVVAFADAGLLARLCSRFPKVRFLATFLSRANQHEACVLASKFRNLHLYGCWWFCNNPSIIEEITKMRVEMLGTAFTAQHSDARVLDQLLYKWPHSRAVLAQVITNEYKKLIRTGGWTPTRREIRRDVGRWFGGSYEEFLSKSLA